MNKQIITILTIISLITIVSATYYSGDTIKIPTGFEIVNCSITNNTYNLTGLNLNWSGENIIVSTVPNYKSDNFTISCWVIKGKNVVEKHYSSGGGSSCSYNPNYDWNCEPWGACINQTQTRICRERNNCGSIYGRPNVVNNCSDVIILDVNDTIIDEPVIIDEPLSWWDNFVNWLKGLFS